MSQSVNTEYYKRRANAKKKALTADLKVLVRKKPKGIVAAVKKVSAETWQEVDCKSCGHCCMSMTPTWKKSEIKRVAAHVGLTYQEYFDKFLYKEDDTGDIMNNSTPCQHFDRKKGLCSIYEIRPHDCATFPHFHRTDFLDQVDEVFVPNMPRCPATLVMVEKLTALMREKGVLR